MTKIDRQLAFNWVYSKVFKKTYQRYRMNERFRGVLTYDIENQSAQQTHVKTMISVLQLSANVFIQAHFLGVKTKAMIPVWRFSVFFDKKEPPVSPTDMMKFANFYLFKINPLFSEDSGKKTSC